MLNRINNAKGEIALFESVYAEYKKAPQITKDRYFIEAMNEIFSKRESIYNQEEHLFRMKDSQINYLNKDVFAELGER